MTDTAKIESLVLEHLRAIRSDLGAVRENQSDHGHRLTRIEASIAGVRREQALDAEAVAHVEARFDRMTDRIDRIERRLDLVE
ncbi:MAG: hypothetical protein ACT4QA_16585 [Panacagrimonas sp.]